ncbi:hypothetical protein EJB05_16762 [Eragrostis curvula]|uniref:Exonuclease 1 n=1 Tax=Eragrostis curvula TaxID=38414 RepID=A0A5J9VFZ5_9POAL|nr:hypothetical protein EJB05_16762 [Eragrostis curvula]
MGIQGLLPQLKSIMVPIRVEELRGQTVAVDTYSWLHKGALSCSDSLCKGIRTTRHIAYCMHRVDLLRHYGVKPILVFDGGLLPIKGDQETKRERSRKENLERAREHEAAGNSRAAFECYQKAVDITPRIAFDLIQVQLCILCPEEKKVDYIVAPYEADAQMAFLSVNKLVDAVITEDSDLIPFGCSRIIFKMDKYGQGVEFQITRLERNRELDFNGFTKLMLLEMCILSGCDYLPSMPGMGVKRAHGLIQKYRCHEKVIKHLRYTSGSVPRQYEEKFKKAIWAFQFQRVYDPSSEDIVHLSDLAKGIALGNIDPLTKEPFEAQPEYSTPVVERVYPARESIVPSNGRKKLELPVQKNILTNYFCLASLEAKRKFRAPKITPKQQILNESSLSSPQTEDSSTPDSVEDTRLPPNHIQASQCSPEQLNSEPPQDDPVTAASQCSSEHFCSEDPCGDSANISPQCISLDDGSYPPPEDTGIEDRKVESDHCKKSMLPNGSYSVGKIQGISEPSLLPHIRQPCIPVQHYNESNVASTDRGVIIRSSYFKAVNKRVHTNQDMLDNNEDDETDNCTLSGDQLRNSGMLKRRKLFRPRNSEDESLHTASYDENPPVADDGASEGCDTDHDHIDDTSTKTEGTFGCNVSHVNKYSGIAEKSMDKFAALISSFRYPGSRASGLRAPLKDVKNTLSVRSVLRPQEQGKFRCATKKTERGPPSKSRCTSDDKKTAGGPPDINAFAYRPVQTSDQSKITSADAVNAPPDLDTFAYTSMAPTVCRTDRNKFTGKTIVTADSPPDLSTFAYKPIKSAVKRAEGRKLAGITLKTVGGTSRSQFR